MSETEKNTSPKGETPPTNQEPQQKLKIEIKRDAEVDSLQQELAQVKAELKTAKDLSDAEKKTLSDEKKRIEDELAEKKAILEQQALTALEQEKAVILELAKQGKLTDEQIDDIEKKLEKPENVSLVKDFVTMLASTIVKETPPSKEPPKTPPSGKAPITPPTTGGDDLATKREVIEDIYRKIQNPKSYTKEEVEEAEKKRDILLKSLITGKAWQQLKSGERIPAFKLFNCPKCNGTIMGDIPEKCPYCGFNLSKTGDIRPEERRR